MLKITYQGYNQSRVLDLRNEWDNEFDFYELATKDGWKAYIKRHPNLGHLCGYVAIPPWHPFYGLRCEDINVWVHGGITWSGFFKGLEGKNEREYQVGFDCAHFNDLTPFRKYTTFLSESPIYRNVPFVMKELDQLLVQCRSSIPTFRRQYA